MKSVGEDWMGTPAAAAYLGLTLRTLYKFIDEGRIPAYKMGRVLRVRRRELDDFIESCRVTPGSLGHLYPPAGELGAGGSTDDDNGERDNDDDTGDQDHREGRPE